MTPRGHFWFDLEMASWCAAESRFTQMRLLQSIRIHGGKADFGSVHIAFHSADLGLRGWRQETDDCLALVNGDTGESLTQGHRTIVVN